MADAVSETITIADEGYRRLERERGDRSVSEVIAENLACGGQLADGTGQRVLERGTDETR